MNRIPVKSSNIAAVGYDAATQTLEVEFLDNHRVYQYEGVPQDLYELTMNSISIGKVFHARIRGRYPEREVTGEVGTRPVEIDPVPEDTLTPQQLDECRQVLRECARLDYEAHSAYLAAMNDIETHRLIMLKRVGADHIPLERLRELMWREALGLRPAEGNVS